MESEIMKEKLWELIRDANGRGRGRIDSDDPERVESDEKELRERFLAIITR